MLNNEERAVYARACLMEPLAELGIGGYDPATDFLPLVDRVRGNAVAMRAVRSSYDLTYAEIMEGLRARNPAVHAMTVEFLVDKFIEVGPGR